MVRISVWFPWALVVRKEVRLLNKFGELNDTPGNLELEWTQKQGGTVKLCEPTSTYPRLTLAPALD